MFDSTGFDREPFGGGGEENRPIRIRAKDVRTGGDYYVDANGTEWLIGGSGSDAQGSYFIISRTVKKAGADPEVKRGRLDYDDSTTILVVRKKF